MAMECAPREYALAQSNQDFAGLELEQGDTRRAREHLDLGLFNARAAHAMASECVPQDTDGDGIGNNADDDDDGDTYSDEDEDACGSNPEKADSVPVDYDQDGICDAIDDSVDETVVGDNTETNTGFDNFRENVPGFTGIISTLALLGAAIGVGLAGRRKDD